MARVFGGALRIAYWSIFLFMYGFLWFFPASLVLSSLHGSALMMGVLGLFIDVAVLRSIVRPWPTVGPAVLGGSVVLHTFYVIVAFVYLLLPVPGEWTRVPGTEDTSDGCLVVQGRNVVLMQSVVGVGRDVGELEEGGQWTPLGTPAPFAWEHGVAGGFGVWVAPRDEPRLHYCPLPCTVWRSRGRPAGDLGSMRVTPDTIWAVVGGRLWRASHIGDFELARPGWTGDVVVAPDDPRRVLAVGPRLSLSEDRGKRWVDVTPEPFEAPHGGAAGEGVWYVYRGEFWARAGMLMVSEDGGPFEARELPVGDVRVMVTWPGRPQEVWLGSWGQGVYRSRDRGRTWEDMGMQGIEVRSMAIDALGGRVWVASSNLLFDRGIFVKHVQ